MKELTKAWLEAAALDVESAKRLSDDEFLTPVVAFHSQQNDTAAEKCYARS